MRGARGRRIRRIRRIRAMLGEAEQMTEIPRKIETHVAQTPKGEPGGPQRSHVHRPESPGTTGQAAQPVADPFPINPQPQASCRHEWRGNFRVYSGAVEGDGQCKLCGMTIREFYARQAT